MPKSSRFLGTLLWPRYTLPYVLRFPNPKTKVMTRKQPNIVVTGTPGVGKTSHCELLARNTGLKHLSINHVVKERGCHEGWNEEYRSWIVNEDEVMQDFVRVPTHWEGGD